MMILGHFVVTFYNIDKLMKTFNAQSKKIFCFRQGNQILKLKRYFPRSI